VLVVGIDTSCDDTSVAVYDAFNNRVLSNIVSSQYRFHAEFGGVVPEIAARKHAENIDIVFEEALKLAKISADEIGLITATNRPGLLPALLVGLTFAKGLGYSLSVPFKAVHHIEAHIFSPFIGSEPPFPFLALVVSGGHTLIALVRGLGDYKLLGKTLDDAVGEAYDKTAKLLGLGYPGGPVIDRIYRSFSGTFLKLPQPRVQGLNYSFSGIKTAVRRLAEKGYPKEQIAASFQRTAISYLLSKLKRAVEESGIKRIAVSGGVSANSLLREELSKTDWEVFLPPLEFTSDNGAMVAYTGYRRFLLEGEDSLEVGASARAPLT
jgi:N6-L-threonylcarbamoyladenine synthase